MRDELIVRTGRMMLRPFRSTDLDDLVELHSDPDVMRYITNGVPDPEDRVATDLGAWVDAGRGGGGAGGGVGFVAAVETQSARFLGWFHLRPGDGCGVGGLELGFRLRQSAWGQGFGTEGSAALVDRGFEDGPVGRIFGQTMLVHHASRRVMEKAGLRLVRTFPTEWPIRIPGDEHGDVEYAVTRAQWEADRVHRLATKELDHPG